MGPLQATIQTVQKGKTEMTIFVLGLMLVAFVVGFTTASVFFHYMINQQRKEFAGANKSEGSLWTTIPKAGEDAEAADRDASATIRIETNPRRNCADWSESSCVTSANW
jgi:hypothetical protein